MIDILSNFFSVNIHVINIKIKLIKIFNSLSIIYANI